MKKTLIAASFLALSTGFAQAADYVIDTKGAHASINFKIQHLGYSWLTGRFNQFDGEFSYDAANPTSAKITVNIDPASIDSNHAERDKHLRSDDFLNVEKFKTAKFVSTKVEDKGDGKLAVHGDLTLHGVTKPVVIDAYKLGEGKDPWGGYRAGFAGTTTIALKDFGIDYDLGPASTHVELDLHVEGKKK
ncbi:YceI family protein [Aliiglaciecola sp. CAU 1673]|uniref:YceI family protein n=1 Tax=Aliiglaciecola sp. CAU 1673 TaxID=3032595 RepID=UPI0023DC0D81|nr:YceI family protein [Aliiglaciecola sp. CAU 1673]MDF2179545.1 YceI family protein [Aliiglaciecola sp. CAU 1673]